MEDPQFNPLQQNYGKHKKIFSDSEEDVIADFIIENYVNQGLYFTNEDFKEIVMAAWNEKYMKYIDSENPDDIKKYKEFHCSAGFITDFKYHHMLLSKVFHLKRRSDQKEYLHGEKLVLIM